MPRLRLQDHNAKFVPTKSRRPPLGQIITFDHAALSISLSSFDFFFFFFFFCYCGGVGDGDLVVFVLCGGGFCMDSGGFSVGAGV